MTDGVNHCQRRSGPLSFTGLAGVCNIGTQEAYSFNEMVAMINDAPGTDIGPVYIECPFDGYVHDTMAD